MRDREETYMADPPRYTDSTPGLGDNPSVGSGRESKPGISRWQKVVGILGLVVVLWVGNGLYETLTGDFGDGGHGPGQNAPVENQDQEPDTDDRDGHTPPAGGHG
jgi:hypothetical protein